MNPLNAIRLSLQSWLKTPVVFALAVLILGVGIGATVAAYGYLNAALLQPLPVRNPHEIMRIAIPTRTSGNMTAGHYYEMVEHSPVLAESAFARIHATVNVQFGERAELVAAGEVSGNYFESLDIAPARGRIFTRDDDTAGAAPVAIISERLWRERFESDEDLVGSLLLLNGRPATVVGIAPEYFTGTARMAVVDVWFPHQQTFVPWQLRHPSMSWYPVTIRLRGDAHAARIEAELESFTSILVKDLGEWWSGYALTLRPERGVAMDADRELATQSMFILGILITLLLIACAVVSNLLIAKLCLRRSELAMRRALGAPRRSIFGLMLMDGMVIAVLGGLVGIALAIVFVRGFSHLGMEMPPGESLNTRVFLFCIAATVMVGLLCGIFPAFQAVRTNINEVLKESSRTSTRFRAGGALIVVQVGFSLALLVASGLFIRSLHETQRIDPGIRMENVLSFVLNLDHLGELDREERIAFQRRLVERLERAPEIASVGITEHRLLQGSGGSNIWVSGAEFSDDSDRWGAGTFRIGPGFLETMDIELIRGRAPTLDDARLIADRRGAAVISESMANHFWPGEDPIGREFKPWGGEESPWTYRVIGVCRDFRTALRTPPWRLFLYGDAESEIVMIAHTRIPPEMMKPKILKLMRDFEPGLPVQDLRTIEESRNQSIQSIRTGFMITLMIGLLGLAISVVGVYAALSNWVRRSSREIGLRMALGAESAAVVRMYMRRGALIVLGGLVLGLAIAAVAMPHARDLLYEVSPWDPMTLVAVPCVLFLAALISCYLSARHATRVFPMEALRSE